MPDAKSDEPATDGELKRKEYERKRFLVLYESFSESELFWRRRCSFSSGGRQFSQASELIRSSTSSRSGSSQDGRS
jgi:hypothetical protein